MDCPRHGIRVEPLFADIQTKGPFKGWHHRHEFALETRDGVGGALVRDRIECEVGFGALGAAGTADANPKFRFQRLKLVGAAECKY